MRVITASTSTALSLVHTGRTSPNTSRSTARDAAIGGMAGHVAKDHREDRAATGAPSVGDKISGGIDKLTGKITNNPAKVAEGQAKTGTL
jgi:hypothetical protein